MRDYGVTYKSVPLMCGSSSTICLAHNPVFHGRAKHIKVRHHFLRYHIEKRGIEMKFIDIERSLADIFTKLLNSSRFASLRGSLMFAIPMTWFEGEPVICLVYLYPFAFFSYSPKSLCFTYYTSLYLLNYTYHCARMSSNEM
jgi:hypothetical protein